MPALTHGRVKNGFNAFKSNKSNPKSKNSRLVSGNESKTLASNVVTGRSMAAKRAINIRASQASLEKKLEDAKNNKGIENTLITGITGTIQLIRTLNVVSS